MVYAIILILILIGIFRYDYLKREQWKLPYYIFIGILLVLLAGLRYRVGIDTPQYMAFFEKVPVLSQLRPQEFSDSRFAPGFVIFISFCKTLSNEFAFFQLLESFIVNIVIFRFFLHNTRKIFVAILLYYCIVYTDFNMEIMREAISVSCFLLAWPFFRDNRWLPYYLLILLGISFHISAIPLLFLPIICLPGIRNIFVYGTRTWIFCAIILAISFAVHAMFFDFIKAVAVTESVVERANAYSKDEMGGLSTVNFFGIIGLVIKYVLYPCIAIYFLNMQKKHDKFFNRETRRLEMLSIMSMYVAMLATGIFVLNRYNNYFIFFSFIIISDWIFSDLKIGMKKVRLDLVSWVIVLLPYFYFSSIAFYTSNVDKNGTLKHYMKYYPYESVFDNEKNQKREKLFRYIN